MQGFEGLLPEAGIKHEGRRIGSIQGRKVRGLDVEHDLQILTKPRACESTQPTSIGSRCRARLRLHSLNMALAPRVDQAVRRVSSWSGIKGSP